MRKAGYISRSGWSAIDNSGVPWEILEVRVHGATLAIRYEDLVEVLSGGMAARVERIGKNWMDYIGGMAGLAQISKSGRALNIDLICGDRFTVALESIRDVLEKRGKYATIAEVPQKVEGPYVKNRLISDYPRLKPISYPINDTESGIPA